jgi:hypothetical protein
VNLLFLKFDATFNSKDKDIAIGNNQSLFCWLSKELSFCSLFSERIEGLRRNNQLLPFCTTTNNNHTIVVASSSIKKN